MGSFFLVNLCLVVITMQFQETKAREIELMENSKDESPLHSSKPLKKLLKLIRTFCNGKSQEEGHVHHHHHHFYHHHHFHHHLYNCFVPPSPISDPNFFPSSEVPKIKVEDEGALPSPTNFVEESGVFPDFLAPPEKASRRSSKTSVCSHTLSIHAETSSAVSIEEIVAQTKTSVTLNIPSPTTGFFAFSSSNSASRKNSRSGKAEVSASTTVSAEINPQHAHGSTPHDKDRAENTKESKEDRKLSVRRKDNELLKHRRFSQPAHVKLSRTRSPEISSYNPSELFDEEVGNFSKNEINPEKGNMNVLSTSDGDAEEEDIKRDSPFKELALESWDKECQHEDNSSKGIKRPSLKRRHISTQSEDDMFESLFNLRQSATYDVTTNRGAWQRLRTLCRKITESKQFTFFIMSAILLNMICMGLEHYQQVRVMHFTRNQHASSLILFLAAK